MTALPLVSLKAANLSLVLLSFHPSPTNCIYQYSFPTLTHMPRSMMSSPARRSSRIQAKVSATGPSVSPSHERDGESEPPSKRRRKNQTAPQPDAEWRRGRRKSKLSRLPDMPLEILFEVRGICLSRGEWRSQRLHSSIGLLLP